MILRYAMVNSSVLKDKISLDGFVLEILWSFAKYITYFVMVVAIGEVAGSIIGHLGLMIVGFVGIELIKINIQSVLEIIGLLTNKSKIFTWDSNIRRSFFEVFYNPASFLTRSDNKFNFLGLLALVVLFFAIGYYFAEKSKAERSGMFVLSRPLSIYTQIIAIVTTANVGFQIVVLTGVAEYGRLTGIGIFIFLLFIAYKLYDILFKIKLKV